MASVLATFKYKVLEIIVPNVYREISLNIVCATAAQWSSTQLATLRLRVRILPRGDENKSYFCLN